jgi:N-acetylmuramoyl-L-alanine amidase
VVIDLPEVSWNVARDASQGRGGLVTGYRQGLFTPGKFRIVLDVSQPIAVRSAMQVVPYGEGRELAIDITPISKMEFERTYVEPPPTVVAALRSAPPLVPGQRPLDGKRVIVIDPGHGGVDPGATGISGTREKDITLEAAIELKRLLDQSGQFRTVLTRTRDVFLALRERVAIARAEHASLFISLHADTIDSRFLTGASVYTLSDQASDAEAAALAAKENRADAIAGANLAAYPEEVAGILIDLAQRETRNDSMKYAHLLVLQLGGRVLEHHTIRSAGFAVLKAPDVPSVLIEMGYLSNPGEERELRDPRYRAKLMGAIKRAIELYFTALDRMTRS